MTDLEHLERVALAATAGPWDVWAERTETKEEAIAELTAQVNLTVDFCGAVYLLNANGKCPATTGCGPTSAANAAFIAAANPQTVLALLDEIDALRKERDEALSRAAPSGSDMVPWQAPEEATRDGTPIDAIISYNAAPVTIRWGVIDAIAGWVDVTQGYWAIGEDTELLAWRPAAPPATQPQGADNGK